MIGRSARKYLRGSEFSSRSRRLKDLLGPFEAPIWAHEPMKKAGLNPFKIEDWFEFKRYVE